MTKHECAIVMAHTGICMLSEESFNVFHEYVEKIMGRPVWTHEMGIPEIAEEIKEKSLPDFMELCRTATDSEVKESDKKEYKIVLNEIECDGRYCTSICDSDFDVMDYASILYCVVEDVIENTSCTFEQLVKRLEPCFGSLQQGEEKK